MVSWEKVLALLEKKRVEWALAALERPNRDCAAYAYGEACGRDAACVELKDAITAIIKEETDEE